MDSKSAPVKNGTNTKPAFDAQKGKGRPKGALNKTTKAAKDAIADAAEKLGGTDRLVEWAKEDPLNERAFWTTIYPKLIPLDMNATISLSNEAQQWFGHSS